MITILKPGKFKGWKGCCGHCECEFVVDNPLSESALELTPCGSSERTVLYIKCPSCLTLTNLKVLLDD